MAEMKRLPGFQDVNSDQQNGGLDELLTYDRTTAARLGLTAQSLDSGLYSAFGQQEVSLIYTQLNQYYVVMEVAPQYWQTPEGLKSIFFHNGSASSKTAVGNTPLASLSTNRETTIPLAINHTGLFPSVTVSFNLAAGMSLSDATLAVTQLKQRLGTPETVHGFFAGTAQAYQQSLGTEKYLVLTALLAVYIVLGMLYESLVHPLTIISTIPSASVGAMLALMLFHQDLNVISIIGIVLLIGIVKKNAIMMIDFALQAEREGGLNTEDAIFAGLHAALPSHPHDHHGRSLRCSSARLRHRDRIGATQAARHYHCRRSAGQPVAHALHHARGLPHARSPAAPHSKAQARA